VRSKVEELELINAELEAIFESSFDEIFVTDQNGVVVRVNSASEKHYNLKAAHIKGKHVKELKKMGIFNPSSTLKVMENKKPVELLQKTNTGRYLHVRAYPLFDQNGELFRIVSFSKDLTELMSLRKKIEQIEGTLETFKKELDYHHELEGIVSKSESMNKVLTLVKKVADVESTVLILGETGVGKSLIANTVHQLSRRKKGIFNEINCAAIPESLIESELFGYEGGSFTGASRNKRKGLIEATNGGTLFLDEIGELPFHLQGKLLHVLQDKKVRPIGSQKSISVNVRIIAATNQNLEKKVEEGTFRRDLYYRLNVIPITIPPLRERKEDIIPLAFHFLMKYNQTYQTNVTLSPKVLDTFLEYTWAGNIREVENMIERLVVTSESDEITTKDLPTDIKKGKMPSIGRTLNEILEDVEKKIILESYTKHQSTYSVAEELGISQSTATRKVRKYIAQ